MMVWKRNFEEFQRFSGSLFHFGDLELNDLIPRVAGPTPCTKTFDPDSFEGISDSFVAPDGGTRLVFVTYFFA